MFYIKSGTTVHYRLFRNCVSLLQRGHKLYYWQMVTQILFNKGMRISHRCFPYFVHLLVSEGKQNEYNYPICPDIHRTQTLTSIMTVCTYMNMEVLFLWEFTYLMSWNQFLPLTRMSVESIYQPPYEDVTSKNSVMCYSTFIVCLTV